MTIDVTEIINDSDLATTFTVIRRTETYGANGRTVKTQVQFPNVVGVVTAIGPSDLDRRDDYQKMARSISIVTKFEMRGSVQGYSPDVVLWRGTNFLVRSIDPYPQFGPGFWQIECTSQDQIDGIQTLNSNAAKLAFNAVSNSSYVGAL